VNAASRGLVSARLGLSEVSYGKDELADRSAQGYVVTPATKRIQQGE
jgi:hypothetical protein